MTQPEKPTSLCDFTKEEVTAIYDSLVRSEMVWRERLTKGSKEYTEDECREKMKEYHELEQKVFWMDR